ncbi:intermembrane transport protein PqiB [Gynuella sunshinyii]|uniref:Paraquat-inducible protein B n=1 Tax=Gynuella sunshinyii YC6258 TaxID=1445510 RepID=A0A0C5VMC0_9GAMM|nr:MlaD family protein [Gynuella sunshinyii]AJQ95862.1 paraquat-inducible protein B [Gynuella sunshinyii YC6258]
MSQDKDDMQELTTPNITYSKHRVSLIWLVPFAAILIGIVMFVQNWLAQGPEITITFLTASGLEAGKTPVKYKDVDIGKVTSVTLNEDQSYVVATVALEKSVEGLARSDTRFWVVRPRIGLSGVSGIDTLISGAYIGVDVGTSDSMTQTFTGLETPPSVINGMPGTVFSIQADDLGSLDIGSPVYYRRIQVGRVSSYQLSDRGDSVDIRVFIDAPYDKFVTEDTRFWNAGGVDISLSADGLKLNTQSAASVLAGGIAFAAPEGDNSRPASSTYVFILAVDKDDAMKPPDGVAISVLLRFSKPLRGLTVGAPVEFSGVNIGSVVSIELDYDQQTGLFPAEVATRIYPGRLGSVRNKLPDDNSSHAEIIAFIKSLVDNGLRAQVRTGNLITGQLYVALDFMPNAEKVDFDATAEPIVLPTVDGDFDRLQVQLASLMSKIEKMPLDSIAIHLDQSLIDLDKTIKQFNTGIVPELSNTLGSINTMITQLSRTLDDQSPLQQSAIQTLESFQQTSRQLQTTFSQINGLLVEDAPMQQSLEQTMLELQRAAKSLRNLTDLLGRNPEALIRGRPENVRVE